MIGSGANVMIVPNERPWKTIQDFIADAKAKPGSISFGSVGIGSAVHIIAEKFRLAAGIEATHVPYRGGSEVIADILGGRIDFYFCPLATALPLIREGQVKALVVSTAKRVADLPDVPTPVEIGLKDADSEIWFGVFVPAKTPRDIVEKLHATGEQGTGQSGDAGKPEKARHRTDADEAGRDGRLVKREMAANLGTDQGRRHQAVRGGLRARRVEESGRGSLATRPAFPPFLREVPRMSALFSPITAARPDLAQPHRGVADVPVLGRERRGHRLALHPLSSLALSGAGDVLHRGDPCGGRSAASRRAASGSTATRPRRR